MLIFSLLGNHEIATLHILKILFALIVNFWSTVAVASGSVDVENVRIQ